MKRFEVIDTDFEPDSWIDNTDQIKGVFEHETIEKILDELDERIKFLETENAQLKEKIERYKYKWLFAEKDNVSKYLQVRELQSQFENAIVPPHKLNEEVYIIDHNEVKHCIITCVSLCSDGIIRYDIEDMNDQSGGYWTLKDDDLYDSEEEAKKHLEERK